MVSLDTSGTSGTIPSSNASLSTCSGEMSTNLARVMADVCQQVAKWQRRQKNAKVRDTVESNKKLTHCIVPVL